MKKFLLAAICLTMTMASFAQGFNPEKKYTIQNYNANYPYVKDDGSDAIKMGALDETAYWIFEPVSGKEDCYYIKNASTGRYAQKVAEETEVEVYLGDTPEEYIIKNDPVGNDCYRFTSSSHAITDFSAGGIGWNWKGKDQNKGTVQSFASVMGANWRSCWTVQEYKEPLTIKAGATYTICNFQNNNAYIKDIDGWVIAIGELDETAYWEFEAAEEEGQYYIKNTESGLYAQEVSAAEGIEVELYETKVAYVIMNDPSKGSDVFGFTSAENEINDFTTGCFGWNWKAGSGATDGTLQSFTAVMGANPRSFWKLTEKDGNATGITKVDSKTANVIYNIQGQKLVAPAKGINIINGKKVVK